MKTINVLIVLLLFGRSVQAANAQGGTLVADNIILSGSIIAIVPTGAIIQGFWSAAPTGYILLEGGTIGDGSSGGTILASTTATGLFTYLWDNLANAQAAVSSGRGGSAMADFAAHKTIALPDTRQRFPIGLAGSGTGSTIGGTGGTIDHLHTVDPPATTTGTPSATVAATNLTGSAASPTHTHTVDIAPFNSGAANPPYIAMRFIIKL